MKCRPHCWTAVFFLTAVSAFLAQLAPGSESPQYAPARGSTVQPQVESQALGPDLPLNLVPTKVVNLRFVIDHRSALNQHTVRVRGIITAALLGDAACPPDRGMCMAPSIVLAESEPGKNRPACSVRVLMAKESKAQDYPIGKAVVLRVTVEGQVTGVVLTKVD
jgi:hypothetical protein